jgi:hypothetical protein
MGREVIRFHSMALLPYSARRARPRQHLRLAVHGIERLPTRQDSRRQIYQLSRALLERAHSICPLLVIVVMLRRACGIFASRNNRNISHKYCRGFCVADMAKRRMVSRRRNTVLFRSAVLVAGHKATDIRASCPDRLGYHPSADLPR